MDVPNRVLSYYVDDDNECVLLILFPRITSAYDGERAWCVKAPPQSEKSANINDISLKRHPSIHLWPLSMRNDTPANRTNRLKYARAIVSLTLKHINNQIKKWRKSFHIMKKKKIFRFRHRCNLELIIIKVPQWLAFNESKLIYSTIH